jgi:hypothetical protein
VRFEPVQGAVGSVRQPDRRQPLGNRGETRPPLYLALDLPRGGGAAGAYDLYVAFFRDIELLRFCYEVGYVLFGLQAVELMFMLVSRSLRARQPDSPPPTKRGELVRCLSRAYL